MIEIHLLIQPLSQPKAKKRVKTFFIQFDIFDQDVFLDITVNNERQNFEAKSSKVDANSSSNDNNGRRSTKEKTLPMSLLKEGSETEVFRKWIMW